MICFWWRCVDVVEYVVEVVGLELRVERIPIFLHLLTLVDCEDDDHV